MPLPMSVIPGRVLYDSAGLSYPFQDDFARSNGGLGGQWYSSATWAIASSKATNTPGVGSNLLTDPGLEVAYAAGLCGTLTKTGSPTLAESASAHGGSKAQQFTAAASGDRLNWPSVTGIAGAWYRYSCWSKRTAGSNTTCVPTLFQTGMLPISQAAFPISSSSYEQKYATGISTTTNGVFCYPAYEVGASSFITLVSDDGVLERLTYADCFAMLDTDSRLASVKVKPDTLVDSSFSGAVAWANALSSPSTYLLATFRRHNTGGSGIRVSLLKCVNGTYTSLIADSSVTFVSGAWLEIRPVDNSTVALYYNDAQVGTNQTVTDVPGAYSGMVVTGGNPLLGFFTG